MNNKESQHPGTQTQIQKQNIVRILEMLCTHSSFTSFYLHPKHNHCSHSVSIPCPFFFIVLPSINEPLNNIF